MSNAQQIEQNLKEIKPLLQDKFKIKKIGYFGSLDKGSFDSDSDIDLLVEFAEHVGWEFFDLKNLLEKLNRKVDLVTKNALKEQLKDTILNQVKNAFEAGKKRFVLFRRYSRVNGENFILC